MDKEDSSIGSRDFSTLSGVNPAKDHFNDLIGRLTKKSSIVDFIGFLSGEEACSVEGAILKLREKNKLRMYSLGKELINDDR